MPPKFIFVRHGEAEHNAAFHRENESLEVFKRPEFKDAPLTKEGIEQSRKTGEELAKFNILDIWSSPMTRAIETALEIFEEVDCSTIYLHDALLEWQSKNQPCNERKAKFQIMEKFPWLNFDLMPDLPPSWFESEPLGLVNHRMKMFILWLAYTYREQPEASHIVIVSHKNAIFSLTGKDLKNAEYVVMSLDEINSVK